MIYDKVKYRRMSDVPYKLDKHSLVMMQKLERGLRYMLDNLLDHDMTMADVAKRAGYSTGHFKEAFAKHFEMPFRQFLTKLRMRQAALDIRNEHFPKTIPKRYGFASAASFSRAFSREMGVSPRQFYMGNYDIPDMPLRKQLGGVPISLEYTIERAFVMRGPMAPPPRGVRSFLMDALALPYTGKYRQFNEVLHREREARTAHAALQADAVGESPRDMQDSNQISGRDNHHIIPVHRPDQISRGGACKAVTSSDVPQSGSAFQDYVGVWNYHPESGIDYVFGPIEERFDSISVLDPPSDIENGIQRVIIQGGRYAVFSYSRPENDRDIPLMQRMLSRFVFQEWIPMNGKVANTMGFTYERFTPEHVYLYLPIKSGMDSSDKLREMKWSLAEWTSRIDELISIDLTVEALADLEGYSAKNYVDVFSMYYGLTPSAYVRRRRLYLAGEEMRAVESAVSDLVGDAHDNQNESWREAILSKYRFVSYEQYCRLFKKEFGDEAAASAGAVADGGVGAGASANAGADASAAITAGADVEATTSGDVRIRQSSASPDLEAYYESNKERVAFEVRRLQDFQILGHSIEESSDDYLPYDLTGRVLYWFTQLFPGFDRLERFFSPDGAKVFIWADDSSLESSAKAGEGEEVSRYYVAHILRSNLESEDEATVQAACSETGAHREVVPGGCYAVFWTVDDLEGYSIEDAFLLLMRCAFGGWIRDNRWRVDFSRRTFVVWRARKLYFHVPTIG